MAKTRKLPKCVRAEEFIKLIKVIPKKDVVARIGFILGYGSGMRISEVVRAAPEHFNGNLFVPESKYGVERFVPIPKGWKVEFIKKLPLMGDRSNKTACKQLERRFNKYRDKAGLNPKYTFHSLRHGFATRLLESGAPINQVSLLMGHADIKTTSIYVKANPKDAIKNYEDLF